MRNYAPKPAVASAAQARRLAHFWGNAASISVTATGYNDPTTVALLKRGWIQPTGEKGKYPNGAEYEAHAVSPAGLDALCGYLLEQRYKRPLLPNDVFPKAAHPATGG